MNTPPKKIKTLSYFVALVMAAATPSLSAQAKPGDKIAIGDSIAYSMPGTTHKNATIGINAKEVLNRTSRVADSTLEGSIVFLSTGTSNEWGSIHLKSHRDKVEQLILRQIEQLHKKKVRAILIPGVADDFLTEKGGVEKNGPKGKKGPINNHTGKPKMQPTKEGLDINNWLSGVIAKAKSKGAPVKFLGGIPANRTHDDVHGDSKWYSSIRWDQGAVGSYSPTSGAPTTNPTSADARVPNTTTYTDEQLKEIFNKHGRIPGITQMQFAADFYDSNSRFGETRDGGSRAHTGIDMSKIGGGRKELVAGDSGVVVAGGSGTAPDTSGNTITIQRDNNGKGQISHHYRYSHMHKASTLKIQDKVARGATVGQMGSTGAQQGEGRINYIHLHLDYLVPESQARSVWLKDRAGKFVKMGVAVNGGELQGGGGVFTDPTPYLPEDRVYDGEGYSKGLNKDYEAWLGNTYRRQFNILYGAELPTAAAGSFVKGDLVKDPTKKIPETVLTQIKKYYQEGKRLTPDELAAIRMSMTEAGMSADAAGYNLSGTYISQRILATAFLVDDGKDFGTLPTSKIDLKLVDQSPKEIIETLGNMRYGNAEWSKAMTEVNSKGMLNEYLMMEAQENFIKQHNLMLRQRIENMLAVITSGELVEYSKKIQALAISAEADVVPGMINLKLEQQGDEWFGGIPTASEYSCPAASERPSRTPEEQEALINKLLDDITHAEAKPEGFNRGQACADEVKNWSYFHGRADTPITSMTPQQLLDRYNTNRNSSYKSGNVDCNIRIFAAGAWQIIPETMKGLLAAFPEDRHKPFNMQLQRKFARHLLMSKSSVRNFIEGKGTLEEAQLGIAQIWASVGVPGSGNSYYSKGNKANKQSTEMVKANLAAIGGCTAIPAGGAGGAVDPACVAGGGTPSEKAVKMAQFATKHALPSTAGDCALYVRRAIDAGGYKVVRQASAYMYHTTGALKKAGFTQIPKEGYVPQVGDIIVTNRDPKNVHGHIQIYNGIGKGWVSDYTHGMYVYRGNRDIYIYRDLSAQSSGSGTNTNQMPAHCQAATQGTSSSSGTGVTNKYTDGQTNTTATSWKGYGGIKQKYNI